MKFQLNNFETGEIKEWDTPSSASRRTLRERIAGIISWSGDNEYHLRLTIPRQQIVIGEVLHQLPVILKRVPLMLVAEDSIAYILLYKYRGMKVFSIEAGDFVGLDSLDKQKTYDVLSVRGEVCGEYPNESFEMLEAVRPRWEDKLLLAPLAYRQTIREKQVGGALLATDEEMRAEASYRLTLLLGYNGDIEYGIPSYYQKYISKPSDDDGEPVIDEAKTVFYDLGYRSGKEAAYKELSPELTVSSYFSNVSVVRYADADWLVTRDYGNEWNWVVKAKEKAADVFAYFVSFSHERIRNWLYMAMLYVSRDMKLWAAEREQTAAKKPSAYIHRLDEHTLNHADTFHEPVMVRIKSLGRYYPKVLFNLDSDLDKIVEGCSFDTICKNDSQSEESK